jgi:GntR family transcriptional regulator
MNSDSHRINRRSVIPLYYQVKEILRNQINDGEFKVREMLPSVSELMETYDVSRHVVNRALAELATEGLVVSRKGVGSFVNPPRFTKQMAILGSFTRSLRAVSGNSTTRVLRQEVVQAEPKVIQALELGEEEQVVLIERVGYVNGESIALTAAYYPLSIGDFLLEENLENQSLYSLLAKVKGVQPYQADMLLSVTFATIEQAGVLDVKEGFPLVCNRGITCDQKGNPFEYSELSYRSDRVEFAITSFRRSSEDQSELVDL